MPNQPHVVLVEDDDVLADFIEKRLVGENLRTTRYARGEDAVAGILSQEDIELILLDISLPDIDGFEVLKRVRAKTSREIPVIVVSNFSNPQDLGWGKKFGIIEFINKVSVTPIDIVNRAQEVIAEHRKKLAS